MTKVLTTSLNGRVRKSIAAGSSLALAAGLMVGGAIAPAAAGTKSYAADGSFTIPEGVVSLLVTTQGGGGGGGAKVGSKDGAAGGQAASVTTAITPTGNTDTLLISIGAAGAAGATGNTGGGGGGGATRITDQAGAITVVAGGGGGGSTGNDDHNNGGGNAGGNAGTANNGGGHDGEGNAGGSGGAKGQGGAAGGAGISCSGCEKGKAGTAYTGGEPAKGTATSGQGGAGGDGYGGGGGGGLAPAGTFAITKANGGGGAGGSTATGAGVGLSNIVSVANTGGAAGTGSAPTAGTPGNAVLTWLEQPSDVQVAPGSGKVTVSWAEPVQPSNLGDVTYQVYQDGKAVAGATNNLGSEITGLIDGQSYQFMVVAKAQASGSPKYITQTNSDVVNAGPSSKPGAPAAPIATSWGSNGDNGYVNLKWSPPSSDGGAKITGYHVQYSTANVILWQPAIGCGTTTALTCQATGLVDGVSYIFKVSASNAIGDGAFSGASAQVTPNIQPPAPVNQSVGKCVRKPSKITLKNKTFPVLAPNCKTNAGQPVRVTATPSQTTGKGRKKKIRYSIFKIGKGKYKGYTAIKTYNVKFKNLKITWSAAAKARPLGQPTGQAYNAWKTTKTYKQVK